MKKLIILLLFLPVILSAIEIDSPRIDYWTVPHFTGAFVAGAGFKMMGMDSRSAYYTTCAGCVLWDVWFDGLHNKQPFGMQSDPRGMDVLDIFGGICGATLWHVYDSRNVEVSVGQRQLKVLYSF